MSWHTELVRIVRYLIDDLADVPVFSDERLQETILVAAQYVLKDIDLTTTYEVDVDELLLTPDPTELSPKDNVFINLTCLKSGCIIDRSIYRSKSNNAGILVKDGQSTLDTRGIADQFKVLLDKGLCAEYEKAKVDYQLGSANPGRAILSPASGPNLFDTYYNSSPYERY
jgi:hypothetical protein